VKTIKSKTMKSKTKTSLGSFAATVAALLAATTGQAQTVTMALTDASSTTEYGNALVGDLNGVGQIIANNDEIGIYSFNVTGISGFAAGVTANTFNPLYSVCLSPLGDLSTASYTYNLVTTANAAGGQYSDPPSTYVANGLNNALYLFNTYAGGIEAMAAGQAKQDAGAALALAMYTALYNSTALGSAVSARTVGANFTLPNLASADSGLNSDYSTYLTDLHGAAAPANDYVLVPTTYASGNGQDMELVVNGGDLIVGVPEASTFVSAALLMLPFGASALRILGRKDRRS
jgi:hypothetical protein